MRLATVLLVAILPSATPAAEENPLRVEARKLSAEASLPVAAGNLLDTDSGAEERAWKWVVVHHSATEAGSVKTIDAYHKTRRDSQGRPWRGIGYHFVIGNGRGMPDGHVEATFRWRQQLSGAHAGTNLHNSRGVGICLIGNFEEALPTPAQQKALSGLVAELSDAYDIDSVIGHRDVRATACPGKLFPRELLSLPPAGEDSVTDPNSRKESP